MDQVSDVIGHSPALARFGPASPAPRLSQLVYPTSGNDLPFEGWSTSAAVAFVAQTQKTVTLTHVDAPALAVLAKVLRSLYLHRELREKGGAYGGFALFNPENGLFSLASYRDPHVVRTLDVYAGIDAFLKDAPLSDEDVKEAILQVCSEIDKPDPPGPTARKAFNRMIVGLNDEARQTFKQNLLKVSRDRMIQVAGDYAIGRREGSGIAVIAGKPGLEAANAQMVGTPLVLRSI
jgi:Zn-dependent M16 (insulinase) family peptidase